MASETVICSVGEGYRSCDRYQRLKLNAMSSPPL